MSPRRNGKVAIHPRARRTKAPGRGQRRLTRSRQPADLGRGGWWVAVMLFAGITGLLVSVLAVRAWRTERD